MDYLAVSEVSRKPREVWRRVAAGAAVGITRRGAPIALVLGVALDEAEVLCAYRTARFGAVVRRLQGHAHATGADRLTEEEIQAEIDAVRRERAVEAASACGSGRSERA
jgi:antitoxin (DNA-binding transcriptional repressor) of toxin-antitoxin stability system